MVGHRVCTGLVLLAAMVFAGCGGGKSSGGPAAGEPKVVTVQHILIAFKGTVDGVSRSKEEAEQLARKLFKRAQKGEDFDSLVETYTDDSFPGVYGMANDGEPADRDRQIYERREMAKNFGDVSFSLGVGEIGLAEYDPDDCKYGWHIIMRIR